MNIVLRSPETPREWCIVELQGTFDTRGQQLDSTSLGELRIRDDGNCSLTIGLHHLEGKVVPLKVPLTVTQKEQEGNEKGGDALSGGPAYRLCGVIRKKYVFKNRPKPLIKGHVPL